MTSAARGLLALVALLALSWPLPSVAECPDAHAVDELDGGVGGTGRAPRAGGVGGTGHSAQEGGVGGTGQRPVDGGVGGTGHGPEDRSDDALAASGGVGGTGVLGQLVEDSAGARMCLAGYQLVTNAETTLLAASGDAQTLAAESAALRSGATVWAVGSVDGTALHADHIEVLAGDSVALSERVAKRGVHHLVLETTRVETGASGALRAAGLTLRASPALVEQSRATGRVRIRAERDDGGYRAVQVEPLPSRVRPERETPTPAPVEPPRSVPDPSRSPVDPTTKAPAPPVPTPTPLPPDAVVPEPPRPPQSDPPPSTRGAPTRPTAVERPAGLDRPTRPETTELPERPTRPDLPPRPPRPHKPDLPPRPTIDRVSPVDG